MTRIRIGCRFYTLQMSGDRYVGKLPHILIKPFLATQLVLCQMPGSGNVPWDEVGQALRDIYYSGKTIT